MYEKCTNCGYDIVLDGMGWVDLSGVLTNICGANTNGDAHEPVEPPPIRLSRPSPEAR